MFMAELLLDLDAIRPLANNIFGVVELKRVVVGLRRGLGSMPPTAAI